MIPEDLDRRAPDAATPRGVIARYRSGCRCPPSDPVITLGEGSTPLVAAEALSDAARLRGLAQGRGVQPDRVVQGPRDDRGAQRRGRPRAPRRWSAPPPGTPRPPPLRTPSRAGCARSCCCRRAGSPPASLPRRSCTAPRSSRSTATSTTASTLARDARRRLSGRAGQLGEPGPDRGAEDRGVRDRRRTRRRARPARPAGRQRREHHRLLAWLQRVRRAPASPTRTPRMWGFQAAGAAPLVLGHPVKDPETVATAIRIGNPASTELADRGAGRVGRTVRGGQRRRRSWPPRASWPPARGSSSSPRRPPGSPGCWPSTQRGELDRGQQIVVTVTGHGLKDVDTALVVQPPSGAAEVVPSRSAAVARACGLMAEATGRGATLAPGPLVTVEVPATSANLGPGFDCFGLALDWRDAVSLEVPDAGFTVEVSGEGADECRGTTSHLIIRPALLGLADLGVDAPGLGLAATTRSRTAAAWLLLGCDRRRPARRRGLAGVARTGSWLLGTPTRSRAIPTMSLRRSTAASCSRTRRSGIRVAGAGCTRVGAAVFVPEHAGGNQRRAGLLPQTVPHVDAAANAGRAALLVHALAGARPAAGRDRGLAAPELSRPAMPESYEFAEPAARRGLRRGDQRRGADRDGARPTGLTSTAAGRATRRCSGAGRAVRADGVAGVPLETG